MIALTMVLSLGTGLAQAPGEPQAPVETVAVPTAPGGPPRRFVFGFLAGITMGASPLPSADFAFFLGGRLVRLGWNFHFREQLPMPELGVVLGVALL